MIFGPGYIFSLIVNVDLLPLRRFISSLCIGIYINIIISYLLDIFVKIGFVELFFSNFMVILIGLIIVYKKKSFPNFSNKLFFKSISLSNLTKKCINLLIIASGLFIATFPFIAFLIFDNGIYPSDPIFNHLKVRYIISMGTFVNEINEASLGYAMSYPLGLEYFISSLSMLEPTYSFLIVRITGPLLTVVTVLCVYILTLNIFKNRIVAFSTFILLGAARIWIWFRKMTLANGIAELFGIYSLVCLNDFIEKNERKSLNEFLIIVAASWLIHPPVAIMYSLFPYTLMQIFSKMSCKRKVYESIRFIILFFSLTLPYWCFISISTILWKIGLVPEAGVKIQFFNIKPEEINFINDVIIPLWSAWSGWNLAYIYGVIPFVLGVISIIFSLKRNTYKIYHLISVLTVLQFAYYFDILEPFSTLSELIYDRKRMLIHTQFNFAILIPTLLAFLLSLKINLKISFMGKINYRINCKKFLLILFYAIISMQLLINYYGLYTSGELFHTYHGYNIDQDYISLLDYLDEKLPFNTTIMIDDMNTLTFEEAITKVSNEKPWIKSYTGLIWESTYQQFITTEYNGYYSPDRSRSFTWLAISRLYPRKIVGGEQFITNILQSNHTKKSFLACFNGIKVDVLIIHNFDFINKIKQIVDTYEIPYILWKNKYIVVFIRDVVENNLQK
ncbi:MAG: hypothetical protein NDF58_03500 [archaeon YNP-LCB-024-027]|nr:hypothetical protein [Candidatus Culexarchaeum yellowstonense]